jgi:IS5 family transposase
VIGELLAAFNGHLESRGWLTMGGQMIDASIVSVPQQRNRCDANAANKAGETPVGWDEEPARRRHTDADTRWTKKHDKTHYGYKNHINVDRRHKLIRRYMVTDAAVHESQVLGDILDGASTVSYVCADSAYRSAETEARVADS